MEFSKEERMAILIDIEKSSLCKTAKWILKIALSPRGCPKCGASDVNSNGDIQMIFQQSDETKERVETEINKSGIATATFRADTTLRQNCTVHCIKVNFLMNQIC